MAVEGFAQHLGEYPAVPGHLPSQHCSQTRCVGFSDTECRMIGRGKRFRQGLEQLAGAAQLEA